MVREGCIKVDKTNGRSLSLQFTCDGDWVENVGKLLLTGKTLLALAPFIFLSPKFMHFVE